MKYAIIAILAIATISISAVCWKQKKSLNEAQESYRSFMREIDSLNAHEKSRQIADSISREKYRADSIRLYGIEGSVAKIPDVVQSIQKKYDVKRKHFDTVSADEQLQLLSGWLSKDSSSGK